MEELKEWNLPPWECQVTFTQHFFLNLYITWYTELVWWSFWRQEEKLFCRAVSHTSCEVHMYSENLSGRLNFITKFLLWYIAATFQQNNPDKVDSHCCGVSVAFWLEKSSICFLLVNDTNLHLTNYSTVEDKLCPFKFVSPANITTVSLNFLLLED